MASGERVFTLYPQDGVAPAANAATPDTVQDTSTPGILIPVLDFDASSDEWMYWLFSCPTNYGGGGFTWRWKGGTDNTSTGTLELELRMLVIADATILTGDLGIDTQTASAVTDTPPATPQDKLNYSTTGTLSHANAGSPSADDYMVLALKRDTATDTNTGDLQLAIAEIEET